MTAAQPSTAILFVCLGNICRSPLAEGVFRHIASVRGTAASFLVDSAGTGDWHRGAAPDPRSIAVAAGHGIDIAMQRARRVGPADFSRFDLILGMDRSNVETLRQAAPASARERIHLFLDYAGGKAQDVPDPYYGGPADFLAVYRMIREASELLADRLAGRVSTRGHASSTM